MSDFRIFEYNIWVDDTEWRQEDDSHAQTKAEIWAVGSINLDYPTEPEWVEIKNDFNVYMKECFEKSQKELRMFHNLRADGSYVLAWLLNNKFEPWTWYDGEIEKFIDMPLKYMPNRTFICRIDDMGQWYSITAKWKNKTVRWVDSLKFLPMSVKAIGKGFHTEYQKLEIEYKGDRHAGDFISEEDSNYLKNDVLVMHEAINKFYNELGAGKMTIAAYAYDDMIKTCFKDKKEYQKIFPNLSKVSCPFKDEAGEQYKNADAWIRDSYRGGWTYLKPEYANKKEKPVIVKNGCTADVNSLYPSKMISEYLPYGLPEWFNGPVPEEIKEKSKNKEIYYFVKIRTRFKIKKNKLPCIQVKNNPVYPPREWLDTSDINGRPCYKGYDGTIKKAEVILTLTQDDYDLIKDHYELIDCEEIEGCYFKCKKGIFDPYIEKWSKIKQENKGINPSRYLIAKLMMNSCYGKMAQGSNVSYKIPFLDEEGILKFKITHAEDNKNVKHVAVASAITAAARKFTISHAQDNFKHFVYADTDSLHCKCAPRYLKNIEEHPTAFNCWKIENEWDEAVFVRAKAYIEHTVKEDKEKCEPYYLIKCAGMGGQAKDTVKSWLENRQMKLEDFAPGFEVAGNLKSCQIEGGLILLDTNYKLR